MLQPVRKTLMFVAALAALSAGGAAFAGAATTKGANSASGASSGSSQSAADRPQRPRQTELTGDTAAKVKAAALAKVPGGTVLRVEADGPGDAAYHAHVRKSDGSEVVVLVNSSFEATSVEADRGGRGHRGGPGGHRGGPGRHGNETPLTGETADKVTAAALAKVPGATVLRVETDADHGSPYEAHLRKSDGTEVEVLVNKDFEATAVNEQRGRP
jgi:uncharacterized membrane protein YkoI